MTAAKPLARYGATQGRARERLPNRPSYTTQWDTTVYSVLDLISDEAFARGIARMKEARTSLGGGPFLEEVDYFVFQRR